MMPSVAWAAAAAALGLALCALADTASLAVPDLPR